MLKSLVLDAMISRADFASKEEEKDLLDLTPSVQPHLLKKSAPFGARLRKPDFQRETNFWNPEQLVSLLESFLDNELVPAVILWQSNSYIFVIDGGHRLSALIAWMEDDYGDGYFSQRFFGNEIPKEQRLIAKKTRELVASRVGTYQYLNGIDANDTAIDQKKRDRAAVLATRSLPLQWVRGDAAKAETSFFKINTKGTALDAVEESLLRERSRSAAIAARSIVRAATGHEYWSSFDGDRQYKIKSISKELHELLFSPDVTVPVRTLDLPIGGSKATINALSILIEICGISDPIIEDGRFKAVRPLAQFSEDKTGDSTVELLTKVKKLLSRVAGNEAASLGLHPAVYYYSDSGKHNTDLLLGVLLLIKEQVHNNNSSFFKKFTASRRLVEEYLRSHKSLILQSIQTVRSQRRPELIKVFLAKLIDQGGIMEEREMVEVLASSTFVKHFVFSESDGLSGKGFSPEAKSTIAMRQILDAAPRCPICNGYLDPVRSASFDHIDRKSEGGSNHPNNGQMTHPYCNSGYKG